MQAGGDVQKLASQLLAVNEDAFRRAPGGIYGGRPNTDDWRVDVPAGGECAGVALRTLQLHLRRVQQRYSG